MKRLPTVVVLVKPGSAAPPAALLKWVRWLLPAAFLVVSQGPVIPTVSKDVIVLNADDIDAGPLTVADAIVKAIERR